MKGAGAMLKAGAPLITYGPYRIDGAHTAESNARFDASLRGRDPAWGLRDVEAVLAMASNSGLALEEQTAMPANNLMLVFRSQG